MRWNHDTILEAAGAFRLFHENRTSEAQWSFTGIEEALDTIMRGSFVPINLCMFIDALDEHRDKHAVLIKVLKRLVKSTDKNRMV